jgi:hypothetical protein
MTRGYRDEGFRRAAGDGDDEPVRLPDVTSVGETEHAVLCRIPGRRADMWIPKSQIHDDSEVYADDQTGVLVITAWLAEKEDLP